MIPCIRCGKPGLVTICTACSEQLRAAAQEAQRTAWRCDRCGRAFNKAHRLAQHQRDAHGQPQESIAS